VPNTGDLRRDLVEVATRVAGTLAAPTSRAMLPLIAGTSDTRLAEAARRYWSSLFEHTAEVVRRAQNHGEASTSVDPTDAIEALLAPIYLRVLVTHQPVTAAFLRGVAETPLG
jgi:hypothetical protein